MDAKERRLKEKEKQMQEQEGDVLNK